MGMLVLFAGAFFGGVMTLALELLIVLLGSSGNTGKREKDKSDEK